MSNRLVSTPRDVSPEIISQWGQNLGSTRLVEHLMNEPRLQQRVYEQLKSLIITEDDEDDQVLFHASASEAETINEAEYAAMKTYIEQPERLTDLCGLIIYGSHVRKQIGKAGFELLSAEFALDDLKFACTASDLHILNIGEGINDGQMVASVRRYGSACVNQWLKALSPASRSELKMLGKWSPKKENGLGRDFDAVYTQAVIELAVDYIGRQMAGEA